MVMCNFYKIWKFLKKNELWKFYSCRTLSYYRNISKFENIIKLERIKINEIIGNTKNHIMDGFK
jgi:hypothetical protein